jgi:RNA:NAD 2'-phosphotransferase (TPT1/KptA family)
MTVEKDLTRVLRHDLHMNIKLGLPFDRRGFLPLSVLQTLLIFKNLTSRRLHEIVEADRKIRFSLEYYEDELFVRANNGHSTGVNPDLRTVYLPWAVHGTFIDAWTFIKADGLKRMDRDYIHLATTITTKQYKRHREVDVYVNCEKMERDGIQTLGCTNGVIYTDGMSGVLCPCYFLKAVYVQTQETLSFTCSYHEH